jgi:hypothetical protein
MSAAMKIRLFIIALMVALPCRLLAQDSVARGAGAKTDSLVARTLAAIDSGNLSDLQKQLRQEAAAALADPRRIDWPAAAELGAFREFARYFAPIPDLADSDRRTLKWLARQPRLMPTLMSAVSRQDSPQRLLALLTAMQADQGSWLNDDADLATAFLVVWDKELAAQEHAGPEPDPCHVIELFNYFQNARNFRFDTRRLPWQLSVYAVDVKVSDPEILRAAARYANRGEIGSAYFDVPYDLAVFEMGSAKQIQSHDFTLPNLLRFGGVCIEQAYFASQVAKTLGIPSCICTGQGGDAGSIAHAWVGFLTMRGRSPRWDFDDGRYAEDLFWSADIIDPQTHQILNDADVGLLAELCNTAPDARLQSALVLKMADAVDASSRVPLYEQTIDLSPGNRLAWMALAIMGQKGELSADDEQSVDRVVAQRLRGPYPDFAWAMLARMPSSRELDAQIQSLNQIVLLFRDRPDLLAKTRIRQGDLLHKADRDDDAMNAYADVLANDLKAGPIILQAMSTVDAILRGRNDLDRLARIYQQVWSRLPMPQPSALAYESPYRQLGRAYAELLGELGNTSAAYIVRRQLGTVELSGPPSP